MAFVTGATGFIGRDVARKLRARGDDVSEKAHRDLGWARRDLDMGLAQGLGLA
jgi:uncharacterized protein YbjT (DUF2867 family)